MALVQPAALAKAVVAKLYRTLTNGDDAVPPQTDNFLSWNTPGIPVQSTDLDSQSETLARLVDFIPDVTALNNTLFSATATPGSSGSLSGEYRDALKMSQVMKTQLSTDVAAKLEKFRNLLQQVVKTTDPATGEQVERTVPSPLLQAYNEKHQRYVAAAFDYNTRRLNAMGTDDSRAVADWALNATLYRQQVDGAMTDWVISGYKNEVEQIAAFISQLTQRDMSVLKGQYLNDFDAARLTSPATGAEYYATSLLPDNFATSAAWTAFAFRAGDYERYRASAVSATSWPVHAGEGFLGLFGDAACRTRYTGSLDRSHTTLTCEIAEAPIMRQWFQSVFLTSRGWRFDDKNPTVKDKQLCDGASPPKGTLPAYPVSAVFVRNMSLSFGQSRAVADFIAHQQTSHTDGYLSFGPFFLGGRDRGYHYADGTVTADGIQLIGFRCHILPRSPDPDPAIPSNAWV